MTREELKTATNDELIDELNYCGYDSYYGDYRDDIVAEIKKRMQEPCEKVVSVMGMTNEEAIFCEKSYIGETNCIDCKYYGTDTCLSRESHKMAVKALEQELILDKIKEEVELKRKMYLDMNDIDWLNGCDYVLSVIDKYKKSEESK